MFGRTNRRNRVKSLGKQAIHQAVGCVAEPLECRVLLSASVLFVLNDGSGTIGEYTTSGATVNASLVSGLSNPTGIAVSGSDLFVVNPGTTDSDGTIGEYTTSGATVNASLVSGLNGPDGIVVSGSDLFVLNDGSGTIGEYTTSGTTVNASLVSGLDDPYCIAMSGSDLFAVHDVGTIGEYTTSGTTVNASLVGLDGGAYGMAVSGSDLFVTYFPDQIGTIGEYTTSGGTVNASLISGLSGPHSIAVSGSDLFVTNDNTIGEYTTSGATVNASLVSGLDAPIGITVVPATAPVVTINPTNQSVAVGDTAIFTAAASGIPTPTVQWQFSTNSGATFTDIDGATNTTYSFTATADKSGYEYQAVFSNLVNPATSNAATLTVTTASGPASVSGIVYNDKNGDGIKERKDAGLANITVTLQKLKHKKPSGRAQTTNTNADGDYSFTNLTAGVTYQISESAPRGDTITQPSTGDYTINLSAGQDLTGENFGDHKNAKASVVRASAPFANTGNLASFAASATESSSLLFGNQDQQGVFTD